MLDNILKCCGCESCVQSCPVGCINFLENSEGFLYPQINKNDCIECGICDRVCPIINNSERREPQRVLASKHYDNKIRINSSSGGVFTYLADNVIEAGGAVFGARFNDKWEVVHDYTYTKDGLGVFRGAKYVQSRIGYVYVEVEKILNLGRKVMFSGTPCQIAGLKKYLRREYDNLLTIDLVCHGVPSPKVWRKYIAEEVIRSGEQKDWVLTSVNFRDKSTGWKCYSVTFTRDSQSDKRSLSDSSFYFENPYMRAFLDNLCLRPSCYDCKFKGGQSGADVTLGDFWGIDKEKPDLDDDKGVGLCLVYDSKKINMFGLEAVDMSYTSAVKWNKCIVSSVRYPLNRDFFMYLIKTKRIGEALYQCTSRNLIWRFKRLIYRKLKMIWR